MDDQFLKELDEEFSNVGTSEAWKRKILDKVVWFSPIGFDQQEMINDRMVEISQSDGGGFNTVWEMRRLTLACSIVGIGEKDLRKWRSDPVFPVKDREGNTSKVVLWKYVYDKLVKWGDTWTDAAFDVFADLMETHKKDCLREIKFENVKSPTEELAELEIRVSELREELGMPPLVEADPHPGETSRPPGGREVPRRDPEPPPAEDPEESVLGFDPFQAVEDEAGPVPQSGPVGPPADVRSGPVGANGPAGPDEAGYRRVQPPPEPRPSPTHEPVPSPAVHQPVRTVPVPQPAPGSSRPTPIQIAMAKQGKLSPAEAERVLAAARVPFDPSEVPEILNSTDPEHAPAQPTSTPDRPYQASTGEVLEEKAERIHAEVPRVNKKAGGQSRNPRFNPPGQ